MDNISGDNNKKPFLTKSQIIDGHKKYILNTIYNLSTSASGGHWRLPRSPAHN